MALQILNTCVNCARCLRACPTDAIWEGIEIFEIDPKICTECRGHFDEHQCQLVCPIPDCIVKYKRSNLI